MAVSLSDILTTLQNGVNGINRLTQTIGDVFPGLGAVSTTARSTAGTFVSFNSSQATGFVPITTSSGAVGYVALYTSS